MKKPLLLLTLALSLVLSGASALAQTPPPTRFEQHKAKLVAHIQDRVAKEQALLACVQAAQDHAALKACKQAEHAAR